MSNIVVIPYFNRPAFLYTTLNQLKKVPDHKRFIYYFSIDYGCDETGVNLIRDFNVPKKFVRRISPRFDGFDKLSFNILTAYKKTLELNPKFVFLIEDDIWVTPDFFEWHLELHERANAFCSVGVNEQPSEVDYIPTEYRSHGVCWPVTNLKRALAYPLYKYFSQPKAFFRQFFPRSKYRHNYLQQEGFFRRVSEHEVVLAPGKPNAYHLGFASQQKGNLLTGTFETQLAAIEAYKKYLRLDSNQELAD